MRPTPLLPLMALLIASPLAGHAQAPPPSTPPKPAVAPAPAQPPKLETVKKTHAEGVLGQNVVDGTGAVIGSVVNVLIDQQGALKAAVVEFAGFLGLGNRDVAIDWSSLRVTQNDTGLVITCLLDADKLKALPEYKVDALSVPVATQPHAAKPGH